MKIAVGCDHSALALKQDVLRLLKDLGHEALDLGTCTPDSCDYPVYAEKVCRSLQSGECERGILICATGIGMSMCANRFAGIRAALCGDTVSAFLTRDHNDANVLVLGARIIGPAVASEIVKVFLSTPFSGGERHARRISLFNDRGIR